MGAHFRILIIGLLLLVIPGAAHAQRGKPPGTPPAPEAQPVPDMPPAPSTEFGPDPFAPPCALHDPRAWHGLWNAEFGCHYDHHHGDDPNTVNDLFGTTLFDLMGGTISHPWQTFSEAGYENDLKHAGYFWHVRRDLPCATPGCIVAFRVLVHQHPTGRDAAVRFHSAVMEAHVLDPATGRPGYVQIPGMWVDFGHLHVDGVRVLDVGMDAEPGRHKQHSSGGAPQLIWYGATRATHTPDRRGRIPRGFASVSVSVHDAWDYTSPLDPSNVDDYVCYPNQNCPANATVLRPHLLNIDGTAAQIGFNRMIVDPDGDGIINWQGYTDRYGVPLVPGTCAIPSLDCVPVVMWGVNIDVTYSCDSICGQLYIDHDVYFGGQSSGWNQPRP